MDSRSIFSQNRSAGCENPGLVSGNGGPTPPKPSGDQNQGLNAAGSSSGGLQGTSSFPPTFSGDEPRPLETDFFRYCTLFFAHLGPEEESEQWASFLPENLRPGNIDEYLEETDKPDIFGNKYWWLSQENSAQEQSSVNQSCDHIRYSRVQLLELREVMAIPENILKIKQEIEAECLDVNQTTKCGGTKGANISPNSMKEAPQTGVKEKHEVENISVNSMEEVPQAGEKEKHEVANISTNSMQEGPQTGEKEKQEGLVSVSKKEKKKRRALTDESKEKRRIARNKKRAEKNRKLGVKRLKIQPLLKPKPVSHCRHYLKGRCHEGEKCKFSHDVQPLTKSLPCCHFARQSCMKGDDCPYDHDLSKYPCNKYVSTGFCPRQENCLFSHKVMSNQDPAPTTGATKPETKASNSDSIQRHSQKPHFVFGAENSKGSVSASKAVKAPQGLSFLKNGNSQKDKQPVPTSTSAHAVVPGNNNNKTAFGRGQKGVALPSNLPTLPNPGVFVFGKNPPHDRNPPVSPNPAGVFVFGKNPPPGHNKRNQQSLLPFGNNNNTQFAGGKKGSATPSNSTTSAFSARLSGLMKNTGSSGRPSLPASASGLSHVIGPWANKNQGSCPVSRFESGINLHASSGGEKGLATPSNSTTSAFSARLSGLMKNNGRSGQPSSLPASASGSSPVIGSWANKNQGTGPVSGFESGVNVHASSGGTNSASADASKKPLSAVEVWEILYGKGSTQ